MNDPKEEIKTFVYGFFHKERPDFLGQGFWTVAIFMDKTIHISRQERVKIPDFSILTRLL